MPKERTNTQHVEVISTNSPPLSPEFMTCRQRRALYSGPRLEPQPIQYGEREMDDRKLRQRAKQVNLGKNTREYVSYLQKVTFDERTEKDPKTPDIHLKCSKRTFDSIARRWRRMLHNYDDSVPEEEAIVEREMFVDDLECDLDAELMQVEEEIRRLEQKKCGTGHEDPSVASSESSIMFKKTFADIVNGKI